ncbi:N-acetyl-gamma-glutamyl-phosphate reductase [Vibrio sp. SS-MA-C1-2]|uniref:N-acetyl-gamma-glutamyl-phosphate reductase n=1 Tax=Vibrio sp. SS-MA-C1-2 TaxID=2908646 RepID=UPI001F1D725E|nr:N-acetyl-gamma-glutamyl-phosphate reductase [Vibrio sp. SS-MA-C1-2]UJF19233.1 N-acetyl-gamma-glutamyl-phosphate reductase [Vibrio sp. SS-MA-C1-2]
MLKAAIVGASGYTGAELAKIVNRHPNLTLSGLYVSQQSVDKNKCLSELYPQLSGVVEQQILPLNDIAEIAADIDIVLLATEHKVSHDIADQFLAKQCVVFDLSGAFRVRSESFYQEFYGFEHQELNWLEQAVYGLAEWNQEQIKEAQLIAVPGCYPTASQLPLKPLLDAGLIDKNQWPVINAVSGVSGAGRKAGLNNSFCQVSLQPYGIFTHRHQPEIAAHLDCDVIFTPHLGNFKRGILATTSCKLNKNVTIEQVSNILTEAYQDADLVRLKGQQAPAIDHVVDTPYCDIGWQQKGEHLILVSAIDNILKGAAGQAVQCINIRFGFEPTAGLL